MSVTDGVRAQIDLRSHLDVRGHHFRQFGEAEKICRCGYVIPAKATVEQVEAMMRTRFGYVPECSGEWHVWKRS